MEAAERVSVQQGESLVSLLRHGPQSLDPTDRWVWLHAPKYAMTTSEYALPGESTGPLSLLVHNPDAAAAGTYSLLRVPTTKWDGRPTSGEPAVRIQLDVTRRHYVHALVEGETQTLREPSATRWIHWRWTDKDGDAMLSDLVARVCADIERLREGGMAALSDMPTDVLNMVFRLAGMQQDADGVWFYYTDADDNRSTLRADGPPAQTLVSGMGGGPR